MVAEEHTSGFRTWQATYIVEDPCFEYSLQELSTVQKDTNVVGCYTCARNGTR